MIVRPRGSPAPSSRPATARLRDAILTVDSIEELVRLFGAMLREHGIAGHFWLRTRDGEAPLPYVGDSPELIGEVGGAIAIDFPDSRLLLASPEQPLDPDAQALLRGYALLYMARVAALHELAGDAGTEGGLSVSERFVLARRLVGAAPIDTALEAGWTVATVSAHENGAVAKLGATSLADAVAIAARRGWLLVNADVISALSAAETGYDPRLFRLSNALGGSRASSGRPG